MHVSQTETVPYTTSIPPSKPRNQHLCNINLQFTDPIQVSPADPRWLFLFSGPGLCLGSLVAWDCPDPLLESVVQKNSLIFSCVSCSLKFFFSCGAPGWLTSVKRLISARVMISLFMGSSPGSCSVLTAQSLEPDSRSVSPSLSSPPPLTLCLSLSKINNKKKKKIQILLTMTIDVYVYICLSLYMYMQTHTHIYIVTHTYTLYIHTHTYIHTYVFIFNMTW